MTEITIRKAEPRDYAAIGEITVAAYSAIEDTDNDVVDEYMEELRNVEKRTKDAEVLVAVDEGDQVLGAVTLVLDTSSSMAEWDEPGVAGFRMLAVALTAQGMGVGRRLAEYCVARAREVGAHAVLIHSRHTMTAARGIYAKLGFKRYTQIDFAVEDIQLDGFRLDL